MTERITVRLPEQLLKRAKRKAAAEGRTLTSLITDGLQRVVGEPHRIAKQGRVLPRVSKATDDPMLASDLGDFSSLQGVDDLDRVDRMKRIKMILLDRDYARFPRLTWRRPSPIGPPRDGEGGSDPTRFRWFVCLPFVAVTIVTTSSAPRSPMPSR